MNGSLAAVALRRFDLTGGSSTVQLAVGRPSGDVPIRVIGGTSRVRLERPAGVAVRVRVVGGVGSVDLEGTRVSKGAGNFERMLGPAGATDRYSLEVVGGASKVTVD